MKRMMRVLFCALAMLMALSTCMVCGAEDREPPDPKFADIVLYEAGTDNWVAGTGGIDILNHGVPTDTYPGVSYDQKSNTLTLNNLDKPGYSLFLDSVGDIRIVIKGTVKLNCIDMYHPLSGLDGSISLSGSGKYVSRGSAGGLRCHCKGAKITIAKNTRIDIKSKKSAIYIHEMNRTKPDPEDVMIVAGNHSKGTFTIKEHKRKGNKSTYSYHWNKATFTKDGKGSDTSDKPAKKAKKPGKGVITKTKVGYWGAGSVAVWWKKLSNCKGYQLDMCTKKNFPKKKIYRQDIGSQYEGGGAKNLPSGNIYIRIRGYNKVDGKTYYGAWSKTKKVKIK